MNQQGKLTLAKGEALLAARSEAQKQRNGFKGASLEKGL